MYRSLTKADYKAKLKVKPETHKMILFQVYNITSKLKIPTFSKQTIQIFFQKLLHIHSHDLTHR